MFKSCFFMILILISNLTKNYIHGPGSVVSSNNRMHMMNNPHKGALCIGEALHVGILP
jgi:hypothetical protein